MSKIENPATTDPGSLEQATRGHPPIEDSGSIPPFDGGEAMRIVNASVFVSAPGAPLSSLVQEITEVVEEQARRAYADPYVLADAKFAADLIRACGPRTFDPTGQIERDNPGSVKK